MKILYDYQIFEMQRVGGISRYFYEIIHNLNTEIDWQISSVYTDNTYVKQLPGVEGAVQPIPKKIDHREAFFFGRQFKGKRLLYQAKTIFFPEPIPIDSNEENKKQSIRQLKLGNFDIFHPTYYDNYFLDYLGNKPLVLTVYDLIHQVFPEFGLKEMRDKNQPMLDRANAIIAISENTKKDLIALFNVPEEKITVTYLANPLQKQNETITKDFTDKIPSKYILFVGERGKYKNFLFFAQVFATLIRQFPTVSIVCAGSPFNGEEHSQFLKLGISEKFISLFVSDTELSFLYKNALAFIFPSMYEGFGMPVLEAFHFGCPVLASQSSSLIEVAGDAAVFFHPKDATSLRHALITILTNPQIRQKKIEEGYKQLGRFSWKLTADKTLSIYKSVL